MNEPDTSDRRFSDDLSPLSQGGSRTNIHPKDVPQPKISSRKARSQIKFDDFMEEPQKPQQSSPQASELKKRLDKMEMLVLSILQEKSSDASSVKSNSSPESLYEKPSPQSVQSRDDRNSNSNVHIVDAESEMDKARDSLGMLKLDPKGKSIYHGETHWGALFGEIEQLEDLICNLTIQQTNRLKRSATQTDPNELIVDAPLPMMSLGGSKMSPLDVLSTIPSQTVCDSLINRYFEIYEPCFSLIHRPVFEKEYTEFWLNARSTELVWVGMFLGMLVLALQSYSPDDLPEIFRGNPRKTWFLWLEGVEVCLSKGKVMLKPALNNVRAVLLWIMTQANYHSRFDWVDNTATAIAMLVRMAQSMGLHRDPKWFNMSAYEAEQRKRIWMLIQYLDLHGSVIQGLPTIISASNSDVSLPGNYNDDDLMPNYDQHPEPHSPNTRTAMSYTIHRARLAKWLSLILDDGNSTGGSSPHVSYEKVLETQQSLLSAYKQAPSYLRKSVLDGDNENCPVDLLMQRVWYEIDYLRTVHALHRYYGALGMDNVKYRGSREECFSASVRLLRISEWFSSTPEGKRTRATYCWIHNNFLLAHYLHATIYLCLSLIDHFDAFSLKTQEDYMSLVERSLVNFNEYCRYFNQYVSISVILDALVSKVRSVAKMTVKQRIDVNRARDRRRKTGYTVNSSFNPMSATPSNKGMTMSLDATDSAVNFDKFNNGFIPDVIAAFSSPDTPNSWLTNNEDMITKGRSMLENDSNLGNNVEFDPNLDLSQLDALYKIGQF